MNETDCVLHGERLLCSSQIRKASVRGADLPVAIVIWRREEVNIQDRILPESLSTTTPNKNEMVHANTKTPKTLQGCRF